VRKRRLTPTPRANRLSSDAPFSDRFLPDRMNGAGIGRPEAPSTAEFDAFRANEFPRSVLGCSFRRSRDRGESERTRRRSIDFCNRREGRAHPRAARYPARQRFSRGRSAIEGRGRQAPVTRLGVELPHCRSPRPDQASPRRTLGLLGSKAGTLVGQGVGEHSWRGCRRPVPPRSAFDLPRER
jgi:hypothetical protein